MRITPELLETFLQCPTKCYLYSKEDQDFSNPYAHWLRERKQTYEREGIAGFQAAHQPPKQIHDVSSKVLHENIDWSLATNIFLTDNLSETRIHCFQQSLRKKKGTASAMTLIRFSFGSKVTAIDKLMLAYDASLASAVLKVRISEAQLVYGDSYTKLRVNTEPLIKTLPKVMVQVALVISSVTPPELILNRHCPECAFHDRCRRLAIEKDELSLLAGLTLKDRERFHRKGIFTITQLSHTFRMRRTSKMQRERALRYNPALKALAIREKQIFVMAAPYETKPGTPVYLDVEADPSRKLHYLIGLCYRINSTFKQHSLWANSSKDEKKIWQQFLKIIERLKTPTIIHYGNFETMFLRYMIAAYGGPAKESVAERALSSTVNLVSAIYGRYYFPTFSNSMKEIASAIGSVRKDPHAHGIHTIAWRDEWESTRSTVIKARLIKYNASDCVQLAEITECLPSLSRAPTSMKNITSRTAPDGSATATSLHLHKSFETILKSAHASYAGSKISLTKRGNRSCTPKNSHKASSARRIPTSSGSRLVNVAPKRICPKHPERRLTKSRQIAERRRCRAGVSPYLLHSLGTPETHAGKSVSLTPDSRRRRWGSRTGEAEGNATQPSPPVSRRLPVGDKPLDLTNRFSGFFLHPGVVAESNCDELCVSPIMSLRYLLTGFAFVLLLTGIAQAQAPAPQRKVPVGVPADAQWFNGKWYRTYNEKMPWNDARHRCTVLGGQLCVIPDQATWVFIREMAGNQSLWLGATDEEVEGVWKWIDGTPFKFTAWQRHQPDNAGGDENYLHIRGRAGWNDARKDGHVSRNENVRGFICEWKDKQ